MRRLVGGVVRFFAAVVLLFALVRPVSALDLTNGLMYAVPTLNGKAPVIDGKLDDWDLSGAEPIWATNQTAPEMNGKLAVEYDSNALYLAGQVTLPHRALLNTNGPVDPFWNGDMMEFRLASDPALPFPLYRNPAVTATDRICHISLWKNTGTGKCYINIAYGADLHKGNVLNPPGSAIAVVEGDGGYVLEARIPWSALNVPNGKIPFAAEQRMTATLAIHWGGAYQIPMLYIHNPGSFAFRNIQDWGQIAFSPEGHLQSHHETMEEAVAAAVPKPTGVPITVDIPDSGKISVNILGPHGEVIRDLCGGIPVKPGKFTTLWDGRDQWGMPVAPGTYKWGAYFSHGLKPLYMGEVGSSGTPPTQTADGTGGWGGDHGVPIAVTADATGHYFGWEGAEAEAYMVKVDYAGKTIWRKSPFVNGGYARLVDIASSGKYVFAVWDGVHPILSRQDAGTGALLPFGDVPGAGSSVPIPAGAPAAAPANSLPFTNPDGTEPECVGLAASSTEVFASVYSQNKIQVFDPETGAPTRTLDCPSPRGLALDAAGNLYAVCYGVNQPASVVMFKGATGQAIPIIVTDLVAPYGVAVDAVGNLHVTDLGSSQQVKTFSPAGKLLAVEGKAGGRPWSGKYDDRAFLMPAGITADSQNGILVAEASIPKIFDCLDAKTGKVLKRWFGWPAYGVSNIADPQDPWTSYYPFEPEGFARARVPAAGGLGMPTAYWDLEKSGVEGVGELYRPNFLPYVKVLANKRKYFISDCNPRGVCLIEGDRMKPVGHLLTMNAHEKDNPTHKNCIEVWIDRNGDGKIEPDEVSTFSTIQGQPLPVLNDTIGSSWMDEMGDVYISATNNTVVKIPSDGFTRDGAIKWDVNKATYVVTVVVPSMVNGFGSSPRYGMGGVRVDNKGDLFTCLTLTVPPLTADLAQKIREKYPDIPESQWCAYATPNLAAQMHEGLGHTAESNAVKFAEYGPDGKMIWIAGQKATASPTPGQMYHFWSLAGMVGDNYVVGASEWGPMYFYTSDGFYVDSIMNDPNQLAPPGPYTFGSETFGGRVQAYPKLGQVWAYNQGGLYQVEGFDKNLHVDAERRMYGEVKLDKVYGSGEEASSLGTMVIQRMPDPLTGAAAWKMLPSNDIKRGNETLAQVRLGYDAKYVYAEYHVSDPTPLVNNADDLRLLFKGGDAVALDLGPAGNRQAPVLGDVRFIAAEIHGQPHLVAMKPISNLNRDPQSYFTPAGGTKHFDFVGEVPGGEVTLSPDADGQGYTAIIGVPLSFLEFSFVPGTALKADVEVLLSGQGSRGLQTISRNPLYAAGHAQTTMVDDTPTESWLYPQFWGNATVK